MEKMAKTLEVVLKSTVYNINKMREIAPLAHANEDNKDSPFINVGFEFEGQWISNPWLDSTGRFDFTDDEMLEEYGVDNLIKYLDSVKDLDEVIIDYSGYSPDLEEITKAVKNFEEGYPEYAKYMHNSIIKRELTGMFLVRFEGFFPKGYLTEEKVIELKRLTHHAEGLYEDTELEYSHVEVFVDGIWFGKANK